MRQKCCTTVSKNLEAQSQSLYVYKGLLANYTDVAVPNKCVHIESNPYTINKRITPKHFLKQSTTVVAKYLKGFGMAIAAVGGCDRHPEHF